MTAGFLVAGCRWPNNICICDECVYLSLEPISREELNLRAAYFGFQLIAKLLILLHFCLAIGAIEKPEARHLLLSIVDRSDLERGTLRNSTIQSTKPTDEQNTGEVRPPTNPRGAEFASLAALAAAPPSSLFYSIPAKGSGQAGTSSLTNDNKALVYQRGTINFVINRLPNNFSVSSVSSPENRLSDAR